MHCPPASRLLASLPADVFSFGCILWELLTWQLPWMGTGGWQVRACTWLPLPLPPPLHGEQQHTHAATLRPCAMQLVNQVLAGARLEAPALAGLPCGTRPDPESYACYVELMRWAGARSWRQLAQRGPPVGEPTEVAPPCPTCAGRAGRRRRARGPPLSTL